MGTETKCRNENTYNEEEEKKQAPEYGKKIFEGKGSNPALDLNAVTIRLREQKEIAQSKQVMLFYDEYREIDGLS
jgi:hypothetical protein